MSRDEAPGTAEGGRGASEAEDDGSGPPRAAGPGDDGGGRPNGAYLALSGLTKRFGDTLAVDDLDLALRQGELLTLLGPSGCGKTTVLRLVAGFESPDAGSVRFRDEEILGQSPRERGFGMVFQNYALFPHLDVFENVAFGLRSRGVDDGEIRRRVGRVLDLVDLPDFGDRAVQGLSGGQQQRVALARALAIEPPLLLLDEPLSNLDAALRERTRTELRLLVKELGITTLFVTHDQEEAFDLSDRVAVMDRGRIRQTGRPEVLYDEPADPFVAGFVGRANRIEVEVRGGPVGRTARLPGGAAWSLTGETRIRDDLMEPGDARDGDGGAGVEAELWVRPEDLTLIPDPEGDPSPTAPSAGENPGGGGAEEQRPLRGTVRDRRFRGAVTVFRVDAGPAGLVEVAGGRNAVAEGETVGVTPAAGARLHLFPRGESRLPAGGRTREGRPEGPGEA